MTMKISFHIPIGREDQDGFHVEPENGMDDERMKNARRTWKPATRKKAIGFFNFAMLVGVTLIIYKLMAARHH